MKLFNSTYKIVLIVEYSGKHYFGFQWQARVATVQDELEKAIRKLTGEKRRVASASRTDTGVHARRQVVIFRTGSELPDETFVNALNFYLPEDIAVINAGRVDPEFDIRRNALSREYEYSIWNSNVRSPILADRIYFVHGKLNIDVMNEACQSLLGEHDFASFASSLEKHKRTKRTIITARFTREGKLVTFYISANSFLTHQVRNTVGLLLRIGLGKLELEELNKIMEAHQPGLAGPAAPACGLCLTKINYPRDVELKYENLFTQSK